jgi:hypothetical protein
MSELQLLSLVFTAAGMSLMGYAGGWMIMRLLAGHGHWAHGADKAVEAVESQPASRMPALKLIINSKRRTRTRLFSTDREAA